MSPTCRQLRPLLAIGLALLALLAREPLRAADAGQVLILNSYHRGFSWSDAEEKGVAGKLREVFPDIEIAVEYLDSKRFPEPGDRQAATDYLERKYRNRGIGLVVALDDPAMELLTDRRDRLFPGVPVVFAGIGDYARYMENGRRKVTGVVEKQDVVNTVETALSLHPGAKRLLVVNDNTSSGISARREVEAAVPRFADRLSVRFLPPCTFEEARAILKGLPPDAIVLIHSFTTDRTGKALSTKESTALVVNAAPAPVYTVHGNRLGEGVVGGFLTDGEAHGRMAAGLALRVLMGADPSAVPVEEMQTSRPMFDFAQLKRFGIDPDRLPPGSVVLNRPATVFETHRKFALGAVLAVLFLSAVVGLMAVAFLRLKRAEEELQLAQYCLDKSPIAFCTVSYEDGKVESANRSLCTYLGYGPGELIGMSIYEFNETITQQSFREHRESVERDGYRSFEAVYRRKDGSKFPVEVMTTILNFKGRRILYSFIKDITERKTAEKEQAQLKEQLFQSQKMETVGLLAGGVAHDFNNLLMPILGYSELLMSGLAPDHPDRRKLDQIHRAAELARTLTMRLLAFGRKQVLRLDAVDLGEVVQGLEHVIRRTIREDIRIETAFPPSPARARADKGQIEQALLNLAVNAQDAMPEGGTLTIEVGRADLNGSGATAPPEILPGEYVTLSVADTGVGMDPETQAHIFEPFFTTKEQGKGTGLGLATVYGIVKQHGGAVTVSSEKGKGSIFRLYLPRAEEAARKAGAAAPERAERGSETVLVAEDNETVRTLACRMLEDLGYTVLSGESADRCLELAGSHPGTIHLLLTDVIMPGMNGRELYDLLKRTRPQLKALFMSGYPGEMIGPHGILEEGVHFLQKPFTAAALARHLRLALRS